MKTKNRLSFHKIIFIISYAIAILSFSTASRAAFLYTYTGNIFTINADQYYPDGIDGPGFYPETFDSFITATVSTQTLFKNGDELKSNMSLSLIGSKGVNFGLTELIFPIFPDPFPEFTPRNHGTLNIDAVDASGLPTEWNIAIYSYVFRGGRGHENYFSTSTNLDNISGYDEPYYEFAGQLINNPGTWTVSEVPEPTNCLLLLVGLGVMSVAKRKHQKSITIKHDF